jgi:Ca2+-binding RTX toxin-like protein
MSGTLTITRIQSGMQFTEVSRTQVGGTGDPDLTVMVTQWTIFGHPPLTKEIYASGRDDLVAGDSFTSQINGFDGADTLSSPAGYLGGDFGNDLLRGGGGDNVVSGGAGDDTIDGGGGFDVVNFWTAPQGAVVDLRIDGPQQTGEGLDVLSNIEGLGGGPLADTLTGDGGANLLAGEPGDDTLFGMEGNDTLVGSDPYEEDPDTPSADYLRGGEGDDRLSGGAGSDDLGGGAGDDTINGNYGWEVDRQNYLRGDEGNDSITGGAAFDDINGNQGNDTVHGVAGDDWAVGGKDDDLLFGDAGNDVVYGNLGNDTGDGGAGNDTVRGGQGEDSLSGGPGDDWLSGDLGDDTISGGAGADIFHSFGDAGLDRVTDFNRAEGDRVQFDPGTTYTVSQAGADVVINLSGAAQMVLLGVSMASLGDGWISVA